MMNYTQTIIEKYLNKPQGVKLSMRNQIQIYVDDNKVYIKDNLISPVYYVEIPSLMNVPQSLGDFIGKYLEVSEDPVFKENTVMDMVYYINTLFGIEV